MTDDDPTERVTPTAEESPAPPVDGSHRGDAPDCKREAEPPHDGGADPPRGHRDEPTGVQEGPSGREVVVPLRLYKTVTVFSTLIAVLSFVLGFILLDAATLEWSFLRRLVDSILLTFGIQFADGTVTASLAIGGLLLIGFGSAVYILGTRFRAQGMGKPQEGSSEDSQ